ncbi:MAG: YkuS family protein [Halanaerobiaceae bacterium]
MQPTIALEENLTNINQELKNNNYTTVNLKKADLDNVDAVIISGQDENVAGMMDKITEVPVLKAGGKKAREIKNKLDEEIKKIK